MRSMLESATKTAEQLGSSWTRGALPTMTGIWGESHEEMARRLRQFVPAGPARDVHETMLSAQTAYLRVLGWWADAMAAQKGATAMDPKALLDLWSRSQKAFLTGMAVPSLTDPLRAWAGVAGGGALPLPANEYVQAMTQLGRHWTDFATRMGEQAARVLKGETKAETVREMFESWMRGYQETLGRLFHIPGEGPARALLDRQITGMDAFAKYQAAQADFYGQMVQPGLEALGELASKTRELTDGPLTPESFEKFYQMLLRTVEERFAELFKSPPFLTALENTLHASLDFHARTTGLMEEQLKGTPVVTRKELDEVLKELHEMRKELRALKKS